ncbi:hypothetical protein JB92DRAFT_2600814, partial [Gautieria morchelliformis]
FPHIESALRLAIVKHEFRPSHLYKLDATVKEHPKSKAFEISDDGEFLQREREASPKDYPSFRALYDPLVIYFEILQYFIIASGNVYMRYEWSAVLQYHFMFHNRRIAEMRNGDDSAWRIMDTELASLYLYG